MSFTTKRLKIGEKMARKKKETWNVRGIFLVVSKTWLSASTISFISDWRENGSVLNFC